MKNAALAVAILIAIAALPVAALAQDTDTGPGPSIKSAHVGAFKLRSIGPAVTSGRISDIVVDPRNPAVWIVATASGGIWRTENAGATFKPVFDGAGSYSIGCLAIDPGDPNIIWAGTGENNSQRSVGYGDGVYRSLDNGKSWKRMGLETSEHIGKIIVDPRNGDIVYVAAQGPLWAAGGERGVYKTADGGKTWEQVLAISEHTGASDLAMDPRNPDVLYAVSYQRRRHVWTLVNGGPESGIHKTNDGGKTWTRLSGGLPGGHVGRIGIALAPSKPDRLYAIVEAAQDRSGFFRTDDSGASWKKMSSYVSGSPQYYQEIVVDHHDPDLVYSNDVRSKLSEDAGETWIDWNESAKHVDNHSIWIDPNNPRHLIAGCDGGIYETWDRCQSWRYLSNLPVTQFYKVGLDQDYPFYNVYGGTQDNYSLGGPSRTRNGNGIMNRDWFVTLGGDGFQSLVDPTNPNIVYSEFQNGGLFRFDKATGETTDIRPLAPRGHAPLVWNWNAPLAISPHDPKRLYYGSNYLFRSDDRGDSWTRISDDLTQQLDRHKMKVMGRIWGADAVSYKRSTSVWGSAVALTESPARKDLLWVGTDDGVIQVTENGGKSWVEFTEFPGVPELTYVSDIAASHHSASTAYATFDNHKRGDFKPYVLKTADGGESWTSIAGDLPERGTVYAIVEDPKSKDLLFCGTEFGAFATLDGGRHWHKLAGIPPVAVRDLAIQSRENDLVAATFGRGFYVLDDYAPLRALTEDSVTAEATLYPVRRAWSYHPAGPVGRGKRGFHGDGFYVADNPPFGAVFTYHLRDSYDTAREKRRAADKKAEKAGKEIAYPTWDALRREDTEKAAMVFLVVEDSEGRFVRRVPASRKKGIYRKAWNLRRASASRAGGDGPLVAPGSYRVRLEIVEDGSIRQLAGPVSFEVEALPGGTLPRDPAALAAFQAQVGKLQREIGAAGRELGEAATRVDDLKKAVLHTPRADRARLADLAALKRAVGELQVAFNGDRTKSSRYEPTEPSLNARLGRAAGSFRSSSPPTSTQREALASAAAWWKELRPELDRIVADLDRIEKELHAAGAPGTSGR